jgi:branched-chain amino acid transport system substrate-binding protein
MKCIAAAVVSALLILANFAGAPGAETPYEINAILPLSGGGAFLGKSEQEGLGALEATINATGGIRGRNVKFIVSDTQTSGQVGLQLVNGLIAKHVAFFIDGAPSTVCNSSIPLVEKAGPLDFCLSPLIYPAPRSYVFASGATSNDLIAVAIRFYRLRGFKRIATISTTDTSGQSNDRAVALAMARPENRDVRIVASEHFNPTDISVTAQLTRMLAARPEALIVSTTGAPLGTVLRGLKDSGADLPVITGNGNMTYTQMEAYASILPRDLYFTSLRGILPAGTLKGPLRDAQAVYVNAFRKQHMRPDIGQSLIWDPVTLIVEALRSIGPAATAEQLHAYVLSQHSWVGTNGVYDFASGDQRGLGDGAIVVARWDAATSTWTQVSAPKGLPNTRTNAK